MNLLSHGKFLLPIPAVVSGVPNQPEIDWVTRWESLSASTPGVSDAAKDLSASRASAEDSQSVPPIFVALERLRAVSTQLRHLIRSQTEEQANLYSQAVAGLVGANLELLAVIALDDSELVNVRAMAARIFLAARPDPKTFHAELEALKASPRPLIRLGVVLGAGDAHDLTLVRAMFDSETHPAVRAEALELLSDVQ